MVLVVEGERDVATAESLGFRATCNPGGSGKWRREFAPHFRGKSVVVIPDNDEPGLVHATQVVSSLSPVALGIQLVKLPAEFKDLTEWVAAGGSNKELDELIRTAQPLKPALASASHLPEAVNAEDLMAMDLPEPKPLIQDLLYPGVTLLIGRPKVGKSWLALLLALSMVTERALAGHFRVHIPGRVLYLALEESKARTKARIKRLMPTPGDEWGCPLT